MNKLFDDFNSEFKNLKDQLDNKKLSKPIIKRGISNNTIEPKVFKSNVTKISKIPTKTATVQTLPNQHSIEIQTEPSPYSTEDLCLKIDEYQNLLDLREIELAELKQNQQSEFKHQVNFQADNTTLKLNQQLLDTQINLDNSYMKLRGCQDALDKMTINYNSCVDDYNDMGEEYEKLADQYSKLHSEYQLLINKYKNANYEKTALEERLRNLNNKKQLNILEVNGSNDLLYVEKEKNKSLLIQLDDAEQLISRLRNKLKNQQEQNHESTTSSVDPESSKFISIINQQQSMIDNLGKTLKSNQVILQEIAKSPDDPEFTPLKTPKLVKSSEHNSPFEFTPTAESTADLKSQWLSTKRELASLEIEGVENALDQLEFHQKELSKLMK